MSKKNNLNPFNVVAIALVAIALSANSAVLGQQQQNPLHDRTVDRAHGIVDMTAPGGVSYTAVDFLGYLTGSYYDPNLNDFPASHITRLNNRIPHFVGSSIEYIDRPPSTGNSEGAANRLWDNAYSIWGYTKVDPTADIDSTMNCHGYSTGLDTWISGMGTLLADEYEPTTLRDHVVPGAIFYNSNPIPLVVHINGVNTQVGTVGGHSSKIEAVHMLAGTHDLTINVVEKNRVSALYEKTFTMEALCPNKDTDPMAHTHSGPCNMANAPLPWSPNGFYRKLP